MRFLRRSDLDLTEARRWVTSTDRAAIDGEFKGDVGLQFAEAVEKFRQSSETRPGDVMEDDDRPVVVGKSGQTGFDPADIVPVARDVVPQRHGVAVLHQVIGGQLSDEVRTDRPAAAERSKGRGTGGQIADESLGLHDLVDCLVARPIPERDRVAESVIPDEVSLEVGPLGEMAMVGEPRADHEEPGM